MQFPNCLKDFLIFFKISQIRQKFVFFDQAREKLTRGLLILMIKFFNLFS